MSAGADASRDTANENREAAEMERCSAGSPPGLAEATVGCSLTSSATGGGLALLHSFHSSSVSYTVVPSEVLMPDMANCCKSTVTVWIACSLNEVKLLHGLALNFRTS